MDKLNVGIVGCGNICSIYLQNLTGIFSDALHVRGVFDRNRALAESRQREFSLECCYDSYEQMLADPHIHIVLDLCPPKAHYSVNRQAIEAGKHVYSEKPLAITYEQGAQLAALAQEKGVYLGCSPDVPLGAMVQTARQAVEQNRIGRVIGVSANLVKQGVETWHPNPAFLYQEGAGPVLDMGPYYLTALLHIVGPFRAVSAMEGISFPTRTITSQPHYGEIIEVTVPTYVNTLLQFDCGALGTFTATFDVWKASLPFLEIYGTEATLRVGDPNRFGGKVEILHRDGSCEEIFSTFGYDDNSRGLGIYDMAKAIRTGGISRVDARYAVHVLETMDAISRSAASGRQIQLETACGCPAAMIP